MGWGLIERVPEWVRRLYPEGLFRLEEGGKGGRRVCLTFDDGPTPEATPEVLRILREAGVKATFFMVGDNVRKHPELARQVAEEGHEVGNHTFHHVRPFACTVEQYFREAEMCGDELERATGRGTRLFRPPHGWISRRKWGRLREKGYRLVFYDVVTRDYSRRLGPEQVLENVRRYTRPGSILVFHDSERSAANTLAALPGALEWLTEEGYEVVSLFRC